MSLRFEGLVNLCRRWRTVPALDYFLYVIACSLKALHVVSFTASVLYYYFYKRTAEYLGDPRLYEDSPWLREVFAQARY